MVIYVYAEHIENSSSCRVAEDKKVLTGLSVYRFCKLEYNYTNLNKISTTTTLWCNFTFGIEKTSWNATYARLRRRLWAGSSLYVIQDNKITGLV